MATLNANGAKTLQQNRPRPTASRPIVPAIPLPYVQKRQQRQAAHAKAREEAAAPPKVEAIAVPPPPTLPAQESAPLVVNGSGREETPEKIEQVSEPAVSAKPSAPAIETDTLEVKVVEETNRHEGKEEVPTSGENVEEPKSAQSEMPPSSSQSSASRSTYQMPPDFVPASNPYNTSTQESLRYQPANAFNGPYPTHHAHLSNGSVMFGNYPDSNNSSPAPPPSGGYMPPPPFPQASYGPSLHHPHHSIGGHSEHLSHGYSAMGPPPPPGYPRQNGAWAGGDFQRQPQVPFGPSDNFSPPGATQLDSNAYESSAPHSFHGSSSSAHEQESGPRFHNQFPAAIINGSNGHIDEVRVYQPSQPIKHPNGAPFITPPAHITLQYPPQGDDFDGLGIYLRSQFADATFADLLLELRYSDDRSPPVRIPGHNLIFARSPALKEKIFAQGRDNEGVTSRTLLIETTDRFLRSDAFWMAVQRLYGLPLLDTGREVIPATISSGPMPGTPAERFDLGLGYAASGHILQMPPVISRGIEIACHFVSWETLERTFEFALEGGLDRSWTLSPQVQRSPPTYGPAVNMLIHAALNFIIHNFPAGFQLDVTAADMIRNSRLPVLPDSRSSVQKPRLSQIRFGDHSTDEREAHANSPVGILSKILINLPFPLLKYLMESRGLGGSPPVRHQVLQDVVQEREKRRLRVFESKSSHAERSALAKEWDAICYQEQVEVLGPNDSTPTLTRTWIDFDSPTA